MNSTVIDSPVAAAAAADRRTPTVVIESHRGLFDLELQTLWDYRELLYFLVWRDVKVRYKQTIIGMAWVVLQPLLTMLIFTLIFGRLAKIPSDGVPYPIFMYSALLPWNLFSSALGRAGDSVVANGGLISKIYFPRLLLPIAGVLSPVLDFVVSFGMLLILMVWFGFAPSWGAVALPLFLLLALLTALAVGLWLSALNVRYRDVGHALPFLVQMWMLVSPVAYPVSMIPERWRFLYGLNPMVGVIEGFRWALIGRQTPDLVVMSVSSVMMLALLLSGILYFRRTERIFADIL